MPNFHTSYTEGSYAIFPILKARCLKFDADGGKARGDSDEDTAYFRWLSWRPFQETRRRLSLMMSATAVLQEALRRDIDVYSEVTFRFHAQYCLPLAANNYVVESSQTVIYASLHTPIF